MEITFRQQKLEKLVNDDRKLEREFGRIQAKKIKQRLDDMRAAASLEDMRHMPGRYHELVGDRKGEWACDLEHPNRLIFTPQETPIPQNEHGGYDWRSIRGVEIIGIADYH